MKGLYSPQPEIDKDLAYRAMGELLKHALQTKSLPSLVLALKAYVYLTEREIIKSSRLSQVTQHPLFVGYYPYTPDELKEMFKNYNINNRNREELLLLLARVIEERNLKHVKKLLERRDNDAIAVIMNVLNYFVEKNCTAFAQLIVKLLGAEEILREIRRKATEETIDKMIEALLSTPTFYPPRPEEKIQPPAAPEGQQPSQQKSESGGNTQSLQPSCCSLSYSTIPRVDPFDPSSFPGKTYVSPS
jgi:hypothetical protein